jgi:hypothetical protein
MPNHRLGVEQLLLILSATLHADIVPNNSNTSTKTRRNKSGVS